MSYELRVCSCYQFLTSNQLKQLSSYFLLTIPYSLLAICSLYAFIKIKSSR